MKPKLMKTNEQRIRALLKDLDTFSTALLVERLMTISTLTKKSIQNEPNKWVNGFVHVDLYKHLCSKIDKHFKND